MILVLPVQKIYKRNSLRINLSCTRSLLILRVEVLAITQNNIKLRAITRKKVARVSLAVRELLEDAFYRTKTKSWSPKQREAFGKVSSSKK